MRKFRFNSAVAVIVANMVGTGVFTSLGFQLQDIQSGFALLALWVVGGLAALCGAMSYAELGAALPRSGGEYNFLTRIYHPAAGFVSGWVSATIGFAGPTALAAITFATYALSTFGIATDSLRSALAVGLIVALTIVHTRNHNVSGGLQVVFTVIKIAVIVAFVAGALYAVDVPQALAFAPQPGDAAVMTSGVFAVALIYVSYAYTGWNAATYLSSELVNPQKNLPRILFVGTLVVMLLYVALNYTFLKVAPMDSMRGQLEVGQIAAEAAFGPTLAKLTGISLALLLVSTVSAMTIAGPRVLQVIGEDIRGLSVLARKNAGGIPYVAVYCQSALAIVFILTSTFESILVFAGFVLALNSFVTVLGVFVLRVRQPELPRPYRTFWFPLPPLIYLALTAFTLIYVLALRPVEGLFGLGIIGSGLAVYILTQHGRASA